MLVYMQYTIIDLHWIVIESKILWIKGEFTPLARFRKRTFCIILYLSNFALIMFLIIRLCFVIKPSNKVLISTNYTVLIWHCGSVCDLGAGEYRLMYFYTLLYIVQYII